MRRWRNKGTLACGASIALAIGVASWARAEPDSSELLRSALEADEPSLFALAQRLGEPRVVSALGDPSDAALQLAAVRLAPHLSDPELALVPLTQLAAGRDPELAAPAAYRLVRIAQALVLDRAGSRERLPSELEPAVPGLRALAADATARPDIRACASQAAHLLGTLGAGSAQVETSTARAP